MGKEEVWTEAEIIWHEDSSELVLTPLYYSSIAQNLFSFRSLQQSPLWLPYLQVVPLSKPFSVMQPELSFCNISVIMLLHCLKHFNDYPFPTKWRLNLLPWLLRAIIFMLFFLSLFLTIFLLTTIIIAISHSSSNHA